MAALNADISPDLKKALERERVDRDVTLKVAVAQAIKVWLSLPQTDIERIIKNDLTGVNLVSSDTTALQSPHAEPQGNPHPAQPDSSPTDTRIRTMEEYLEQGARILEELRELARDREETMRGRGGRDRKRPGGRG